MANNGDNTKGTFSVAIFGASPGEDFDAMFFTFLLQEILGTEYSVTLDNFRQVDEWNSRPNDYNLFIIFLNPVFSTPRTGGEVDVPKLIIRIKAQYQRPVIVLTNGHRYNTDDAIIFTQAGADGFFSFLPPFPRTIFNQTLQSSVAQSRAIDAQTTRHPELRPLEIVIVGDTEWLTEMLGFAIEQRYENAAVKIFKDGDLAWQELSQREPDLLLTTLLREKGPNGFKMLSALAASGKRFPVLVFDGAMDNPGEEHVRQLVNSNFKVACLYCPFTVDLFYKTLSELLGWEGDGVSPAE